MKVKCEIEMDLDEGEYSMKFNNLSAPGDPIEYNEVIEFLRGVMESFEDQMGASIEDEKDERAFKLIH